MRNLHRALRREKHLRHYGRLQYGLFLKVIAVILYKISLAKGIGLDIEEALVFWRSAFSMTSDDKFRKEYQYNIRHSYGLEGGRRNYKPLRYLIYLLL
jgi:DNA primase large subunit